MKLITIFSGKGGVGKTTISVLLASWLKYYMKERVVVYDFESPESRMYNKREEDKHFLEIETPVLKRFVGDNKDFYPMAAIKGKASGYSEHDLNVISENIRKAKASGPGYIICDFPGRFESKEAVYTLIRKGLIDLVVFPLQPEQQSVSSMLVIVNKFLRLENFIQVPNHKQDILCFWNMVTHNDRRSKQDILAEYEKIFKAMNIPVSPTRLRYVDTVKRLSCHPMMVTTTVCYPRLNVMKAFPPDPGTDKPYIENLFQEIKDRVDSVK